MKHEIEDILKKIEDCNRRIRRVLESDEHEATVKIVTSHEAKMVKYYTKQLIELSK